MTTITKSATVARVNFSKMFNEYLLSCVTDYDGNELETKQEKIDMIVNAFLSEKGHEIKTRNVQTAALNWLQGLPTVCTVEFYNDEIETRMKEWNFIKTKDTKNTVSNKIDLYWQRLAYEIVKMVQKKYGYNVASWFNR